MRQRKGIGGTLLIGLVIGGFYLFQYFGSATTNETTGETQYISMSVDDEIALGLNSRAQMAQQHGGLHPDQQAQAQVDEVGRKLVQNTVVRNTEYHYEFHLLADSRTVNAFALPGGQIFITAALFSRLESIDQLAGVLGHEVGHVVARHSAERLAKQQLAQGLTGAAVIATGDPNAAGYAQMISNTINMKYGREQELQSDELGVRFMIEAGYDPNALIGVMRILEAASGGSRQPEFSSTHPSPENRVERIKDAIRKYGGTFSGQYN